MKIVHIMRWSDSLDEWMTLAEAVSEDSELLDDYAIGWIDADIEIHGNVFRRSDYYYQVKGVTVVA